MSVSCAGVYGISNVDSPSCAGCDWFDDVASECECYEFVVRRVVLDSYSCASDSVGSVASFWLCAAASSSWNVGAVLLVRSYAECSYAGFDVECEVEVRWYEGSAAGCADSAECAAPGSNVFVCVTESGVRPAEWSSSSASGAASPTGCC